MKKRKKFFVLSVFTLIVFTLYVPLNCYSKNNTANAAAIDLFSNSAKTTASQMGYDPQTNQLTILNQISLIVNVVFGLTGVIVFVLIIYGCIFWMTAGGNDEQVKKAQKIIQRAVIGLIIVVLAYAITYFILKAILVK